MDFDDLFKLAFVVILILGSVFGHLIERMARKKREAEKKRRAEERGQSYEAGEEPLQEPDFPEAKLPYEELADEIFGDYIESRQQKYDDMVVEEVREAPVTYRKPKRGPVVSKLVKPEPEIIHIEHAQHDPEHDLVPPEPVHHQFKVEEKRDAHTLNLEEFVFKGRNVSPIVQAIVYSEIFGRPRAMRGFRR